MISREVRERLKLKPGDTLRYRVTSDGILLNKATEAGDDPFAAFSEWRSEADEKNLWRVVGHLVLRHGRSLTRPSTSFPTATIARRGYPGTRPRMVLAPSARQPPPAACSNLVLFTDRVSQIGHLQLVSSEDVDWPDWRTKNRRA